MIDDRKRQVLAAFAEGRKYYKLMDFKKALECFKSALASDPQDAPSAEYCRRCAYYLENPPPEDWDGVYVMTTK